MSEYVKSLRKYLLFFQTNGKNIMGLSHKSHGKRSDKETQSPMLKIFADMMQKDKRSDPEKTNLLKEKHHERKRKHYSGSRSKVVCQAVSSSSDHAKNEPYKLIQEKRNAEYDGCASHHTLPFQGEKRESWWFCGEADAQKSNAEDSCSCVSCALKKLINTDYACIACITIMLIVSVVIAVMLVYKNIPYTITTERRSTALNPNYKTESERLKRKIGGLEKWNFGSKKQWRNIFKRDGDLDLGSISVSDNGMSNLVESENELSKLLGSEKLSDIKQSDRLRDFYRKLIQTDAAIRNLRKSLNDNAYTSTNNFDFNNNFGVNSNFDINNYDINLDVNNKANLDNLIDSDRLKRSVNFHPRNLFHFKRRETTTESKISNGKLITKSTINMSSDKKSKDKENKDNKISRNKRFGNFSDGIIIEKNKVMIQYKPRVVPKCSHSPADTKSHEKGLAHPFYKNTQRLDELLDQFIDKKLPDLLADRLQFGLMFEHDKNKKCKHPANEEVIVIKDDGLLKDYEQKDQADQGTDDNHTDRDSTDYANSNNVNQKNFQVIGTSKQANNNKVDLSTVKAYIVEKEDSNIVSKDVKHSAEGFENDFFEDSDGVDKTTAKSSTGGYDILLSISTLVNPVMKRVTNKPTTEFAERPNQRKLLQTNNNAEDGVAYEDLKEVLADYKEGHDDEDKENDRKKRNFQDDIHSDTQVKIDENKQTLPIGVHNPNWKGPMPLYPDEINQMAIKTQNSEHKVGIPIHNRELAPDTDNLESSKSDVEYVEAYLDNGYERLVELAQAYSDYGVFNEKKDINAEKKETEKELTLKDRKAERPKKFSDSLKRGLRYNRNLFEKIKQGRPLSEGIRIEIQPNPKERPADDAGLNLKELLNRHVKIWKDGAENHASEYTPVPDITTNIKIGDLTIPVTDTTKTNKIFNPSNHIIYKKRTLKADNFDGDAENTIDKKIGPIKNSSGLQFNLNTHNENRINDAKINTNVPDKTLKLETTGKGNTVGLEFTHIDVTLSHNIKDERVKPSKNKSDTKLNEVIVETGKNHTNGESTLSNFLMLLSNMFSAMDKLEVNAKNISKVIPSSNNVKVKKYSNVSNTSESAVAYPEYDSAMIENIGHRSRVLLSVEVSNSTDKADHLTSESERNQIEKVPSSTESMKVENSTRSQHETSESIKNNQAVSNETSNRMVKRQAIDDSNLIFWNDLYDEEYGVNADSIESDIRDKQSVQKNDLLKKSNSWIQDKVKMITDKIYPGNKKDCKDKSKDASKHSKRNIKYDSDDDEYTNKLDLAALTRRMKEVCKETVKAVQDTNHIQVRENNQEGQAATSLMQQLVRLMTDLVDFQVQDRTCRRLPPDLQSFLEWLTSSKEDDPIIETYMKDKDDADHYAIDFANNLDKPTEHDLLQPSERESTDSKTDCLGTLHAVQNLIREYEEMNEDDKSVMTGVKSYLENQMHFLQRQLSSIDDFKYFNRGSRYRRDAIADFGQTVSSSINDTAKQLEKQYKTLKDIYRKYKSKIGPAYRKALKTTEDIGKAVTDVAHKIMNPNISPNKHTKVLHHQKVPNHQKVHKHPKAKPNDKSKEHNVKEKCQTTKKHKANFFRKTKAKPKEKVGYANVNYPINTDNLFGMNVDQAFDKDERNIKDVYFKAVEEAKKSSMTKGAHKRDRNMFDKTDIYRINDYDVDKAI